MRKEYFVTLLVVLMTCATFGTMFAQNNYSKMDMVVNKLESGIDFWTYPQIQKGKFNFYANPLGKASPTSSLLQCPVTIQANYRESDESKDVGVAFDYTTESGLLGMEYKLGKGFKIGASYGLKTYLSKDSVNVQHVGSGFIKSPFGNVFGQYMTAGKSIAGTAKMIGYSLPQFNFTNWRRIFNQTTFYAKAAWYSYEKFENGSAAVSQSLVDCPPTKDTPDMLLEWDVRCSPMSWSGKVDGARSIELGGNFWKKLGFSYKHTSFNQSETNNAGSATLCYHLYEKEYGIETSGTRGSVYVEPEFKMYGIESITEYTVQVHNVLSFTYQSEKGTYANLESYNNEAVWANLTIPF